MRSMTGYGIGVIETDTRLLTIELKTVNNRYIEINSRLPKALSACDDIIRREIQKNIKRGNVDVFFNYERKSGEGKTITIDLPLANEYVKAAKILRTDFCLENDFNVTALIRSPEVIKLDNKNDDNEFLTANIKECVLLAISDLNKMRETEGGTIKEDLSSLTAKIIEALQEITKRSVKVVSEYRLKLENRIKDILQSVEVDEARLLNEVAFFADKADINEEISRLSSHISQFLNTLESDEPQGRKLDFIAQEMNREINTIGSKCNDIELTGYVIEMKNDLEKIKEQIRNVE